MDILNKNLSVSHFTVKPRKDGPFPLRDRDRHWTNIFRIRISIVIRTLQKPSARWYSTKYIADDITEPAFLDDRLEYLQKAVTHPRGNHCYRNQIE